MGINIVESDLPIEKNTVAICENCGKLGYTRKVKAYSAFGGADRGYYDICFRCFRPIFRWRDNSLKDSRVWETPYSLESYISDLDAAEKRIDSKSDVCAA